MRPNAAPARPASQRLALRLAFMLPVALSLVAGVAGGLLRAGVPWPEAASGAWLGPAAGEHAFLMICTFMGTVIGIERAVAVKHGLAFADPATSALAGVLALNGATSAATWLVVIAAGAFVAVNLVVVRRQRAPHTALLLVASVCWASGSLLHALGLPAVAVVPWWFCFLVLTIAAERLEMTRLMRRREGAATALYLTCGALLAGAALSGLAARSGGVLFGLALLALAAWLATFDIARRTVRTQGLGRYMAICLLLGYGWLAVAGAAWVATACGLPWRDAALHGLALGFVFNMMLGHAPVILPAVARVKVLFGWPYYVPLVLLHGSLLLRLAGASFDLRAFAAGAAGNALAIGVFAATVAASALAWRYSHPSLPRSQTGPHGTAAEH